MATNTYQKNAIEAKIELLKQSIGKFPNFPKEGILFRYFTLKLIKMCFIIIFNL